MVQVHKAVVCAISDVVASLKAFSKDCIKGLSPFSFSLCPFVVRRWVRDNIYIVQCIAFFLFAFVTLHWYLLEYLYNMSSATYFSRHFF